MSYTQDELDRVQKMQAAIYNPSVSPGDGFSMPLMLAIFARVVALRDFATAQAQINITLASRIASLEYRLANHVEDAAEVYLALTPDFE